MYSDNGQLNIISLSRNLNPFSKPIYITMSIVKTIILYSSVMCLKACNIFTFISVFKRSVVFSLSGYPTELS